MCITVGQGQIRLKPQQKNNIKAFTQWVKDQYRLGMDTTRLPFPDIDTEKFMRRAKTHQLFVFKSDTISKAAKPVRLTNKFKWEDCAPTFTNYVRAITGRDGVPLKYIIGENYLPYLTPNKDFLDNYLNPSWVNCSLSMKQRYIHSLSTLYPRMKKLNILPKYTNTEETDGMTVRH